MTTNSLGKHYLTVDINQARLLLKLIEQNVDFETLDVGNVLDMNMITVQLEQIIKELDNE